MAPCRLASLGLVTALGADGMLGTADDGWDLLAVHEIPEALPVLRPPLAIRRPVDLGDGLVVVGDHRDTASIQGALVSGRRGAGALLHYLGLTPGSGAAGEAGDASPALRTSGEAVGDAR